MSLFMTDVIGKGSKKRVYFFSLF